MHNMIIKFKKSIYVTMLDWGFSTPVLVSPDLTISLGNVQAGSIDNSTDILKVEKRKYV